jgi:two-component sensor histidine kinase
MGETSLDINAAIPVGLIVSELVSNALKYAFPEGRNGNIRIGLEPAPGDRLILGVADDGVGLPAGLDVRKAGSLGLQIVNMLVDQLGGRLEVDRKAGTGFRIDFREPKRQRPS